MNITFTNERTTAWEQMLDLGSGETLESKIQAHLDTIADSHIESNLDNTFQEKTKEEKENLLS